MLAARVFSIALSLAILLSGREGFANPPVTETYLFHDSFLPNEGAGNVLVPVSNATAAGIVTSGPDFRNGQFVTETISASACPQTPTIRAWSFPNMAGLRHANSTPTIATGSYSISMLMRYNPMDGGYARLIDFSNSTLDTGIYKLNNGVSFYPVGTFAAGSFVTNQDVFVTITRDAASKLVSLYINGTPSGTYTDTGNLYAPNATLLYFLMDNTTGSAAVSETDPGVIAYLQIRDTPMSANEVTASLDAICSAVAACGDGVLGGIEQCDDGNAVSGDGCSLGCNVEDCWTCTGTPSVCTPKLAQTPCADDGIACTDDVCDGAGHCGINNCTTSTTTTSTTTTTTTTTTTSTTTTSTTTTTTTTTQPADCASAPGTATYDSILCRLNALLARVQGESRLGNFQAKSAKNLQLAIARVQAAQSATTTKAARKRLQQAAKAIAQYTHRLGSLTARKTLDSALRLDFQNAGDRIAPDMKTLRSQT